MGSVAMSKKGEIFQCDPSAAGGRAYSISHAFEVTTSTGKDYYDVVNGCVENSPSSTQGKAFWNPRSSEGGAGVDVSAMQPTLTVSLWDAATYYWLDDYVAMSADA